MAVAKITSLILKSKKGSTLIGTLFIIVGLTFFASSVIYVTNGENRATVNEMQTSQALYVGNAGLEYASQALNMGKSPDVNNKSFGEGSFSIVSYPTDETVVVTSQVGDAKKIQTINGAFASDCVGFNDTIPYTEGYEIKNVSFSKGCNDISIITSMKVEWDWRECVLASPAYDEYCGENDGGPDSQNALVNFVYLESTPVYKPGYVGLPLGGAASGTTINIGDAGLYGNGSLEFTGSPHSITFDQMHPGGGIYHLTLYFADGSQTSTTFKDKLGESVSSNPLDPGFTQEGGMITIDPDKEVTVEVLGSSITYGANGPKVPVRIQLGTMMDEQITYEDLYDGKPVYGGESFNATILSTTAYVLKAEAKYGKKFYAEYSSINGANVKTLVNGEAVPNIDGFGDQASLEEFLASYVDEFGNIALPPNQVIMLFELGVDVSKYPNSSAADFQDLVVLFTIKTPESTTEEVPPEYAPYADPDHPGYFLICHVPPGEPENQMTLSVSLSSWEEGHSSGGNTHDQDYLGPCQEYVPDNAGEEESTWEESEESLYYWWYGSSSQKNL